VVVDITSLKRGLKFQLVFSGLSHNYPCDDTFIEIKPMIGECPMLQLEVCCCHNGPSYGYH
jgi:hypothetical protein